MIKVQVASDIHLEYYGRHRPLMDHFIRPAAPILLLCGDIGNAFDERYETFLKECSTSFEKVFLIPGNHEYFNIGKATYTMEEHFSKLAYVVQAFSNIHLLNRATYELLPGLHIVGCTLWSHVYKMYYDTATKRSNDIRRIRTGGGLLTLDSMNEMHMTDLKWLEKTLAATAARGEKAIVMTHHMPTYLLIDEKYDSEVETNCLFATQLDRLIREPVVAWFCGHSHTAKRVVKNGIVVALNPFGAPQENVGRRVLDCVFDVPVPEHVSEPIHASRPDSELWP